MRALYHHFALAYFEWALEHIDPLHEDVPYIVQRISELKEKLS